LDEAAIGQELVPSGHGGHGGGVPSTIMFTFSQPLPSSRQIKEEKERGIEQLEAALGKKAQNC